MIKAAPSILAADGLNLERDVARMAQAGCDWVHVDIMDAHFVPNLSYGPAVVKALRPRFQLPLDVHLMMDNPDAYIDVFCDAGADVLTIHAEIPGDIAGMLKRIRARGVKAGLALKPATAPAEVAPLLPLCDVCLVMSVEPGFGGQSFMPQVVDKLPALRQLGFAGEIEMDGGINMDNIGTLAQAGLDVAVMGTALYRHAAPAEAIAAIHRL